MYYPEISLYDLLSLKHFAARASQNAYSMKTIQTANGSGLCIRLSNISNENRVLLSTSITVLRHIRQNVNGPVYFPTTGFFLSLFVTFYCVDFLQAHWIR